MNEPTPRAAQRSSAAQPSSRPRVAVCLSGMARNAPQNLKFARAFLDNSGADVFFHFWETADQDLIVRSLQPKQHVFEPVTQAPEAAAPVRGEKFVPASRRTNIPSMFYSIMSSNALKRAYEQEHGFRYDVVVRLRLDFFSVTTLAEILDRLPADAREWDRTLYVPDMAHAMGMNDQLALGSSDTMDVYASTFTRLQAFEAKDFYVAENMLLRHVRDAGIRIRVFPFEYVLLRTDPIATFDLPDLIDTARTGWWTVPLPDIAPEDVEAYLVAVADSASLIDELTLETPKAFRLRAGTHGYVVYGDESGQFSFTQDPDGASLFVVIVANDGDRRAVNIRPRGGTLPSGTAQVPKVRNVSVHPDSRGILTTTGEADGDAAAFLIAGEPGAVTFEWRPGFWRTPRDSVTDTLRVPGGREQTPVRASRPGPRLFMQPVDGGLGVAPAAGDHGVFALEYVPDAAVESSPMGLLGSVRTGPPRRGDPPLGRAIWLAYRGVRTLEERGPRVVLMQAVDFVRRRTKLGRFAGRKRGSGADERSSRERG